MVAKLNGEKLVMRVFDPDVLLKKPVDLGFTAAEQGIWEDMLSKPHGIILVTGPTGSGKTTTLYTSLQELATPQVNLCTIEDPIELIVPAFNQMQVQSNIDLDFATCRNRTNGYSGSPYWSPCYQYPAYQRCTGSHYSTA